MKCKRTEARGVACGCKLRPLVASAAWLRVAE